MKEVQVRDITVIASHTSGEAIDQVDRHSRFRGRMRYLGIFGNVQLQIVAYHSANRLGRPLAKPRNFTKNVTVE